MADMPTVLEGIALGMFETLITLAVGAAIGYALREALSHYRRSKSRRRSGME
jgi:hypothetical protein